MNTVESILGKELYGRVQEKLGTDKGLMIDDGMSIPKHRFDCINICLKDHKKLVADLRQENERIKARLGALDEIESELKELKAERCILELIMQAKPRNYAAVLSLIRATGLIGKKLEAAVRKQLLQLKETEPYLFYETEQLYRLVPVSPPAQTELRNE